MNQLTRREEEVLRLRAQGAPIKAVAASLGISHQTAKNHCSHAFDKLGAACLADALGALGWIEVANQRKLLERLIAIEVAESSARLAVLKTELALLESDR